MWRKVDKFQDDGAAPVGFTEEILQEEEEAAPWLIEGAWEGKGW